MIAKGLKKKTKLAVRNTAYFANATTKQQQ